MRRNLNIYTLLSIILIVIVLLIIKQLRVPEPQILPKSLTPESDWSSKQSGGSTELKNSNSGEQQHRNDEERIQESGENIEISIHLLKVFAKAFVHVQAYLDIAGREASYEGTTNIVKKHGISIEEYTRIATKINKDPEFRVLVQGLVKEVDLR